ncbi:LacI family DNA-binding transcriptional regulator [Cohnella faecalis]|uniref:LacI family transcriptional regulator n=1 Tax=Cohnella faecalis TaxID=2315694 RepID=A0A398CN48_9BACL|nr:LacI family DNA-binding transcriptional regulator [Cohnella faecalis]RIE03660.1 LacI family transcriptional regulator [Cohnella faecalis]
MKMEDIARLANVSKSAVSLALSGKPGIGAETRERIIQIANEHGYEGKAKAPVSADKLSRSLLFLVFANSGIVLEHYYQQPFFRELIHYIEERCRSKGFTLQFTSVDMESIGSIPAIVEENRSSGVILLGTNLSRQHIADVAEKLPRLVVLDTCFETLPVSFVEINNAMGAYQAGAYLCGMGHRDIGYIASNVRIHNFDARKQGFEAALRENGLEIASERTFAVAPTILSSQEAMKEQFERYLATYGKLPTALFCECDYIAISALKTLTELGQRVPEDVSIVGFDNISEAVIVSPELTTVHVEKSKLAYSAVDLLVEQIETNADVSVKTRVDTKLVQRLSCRAPGQTARPTYEKQPERA